ncbi:aminotransferase class III-fold pyridoxal phosphate-dependent enzyme [Pseudoroseomonas wenyumeiae]|uniref:Aminotransferase class III-fold pyridoxal phosphate-dependent enzyme n=1 Tax=Teichococcus wenyumeiae TaxID=2478470 RepID=A0A3A9K362_9PROT|nr:aminotransferase class III-fold pyridoxal phosphate-dependent enzyme [Pseudoroseomonas wenyumeiae]RKK05809.1 aminotransferase class III-fold pyridoxal phosphate-dependent enzyme [Pseudoroseomonas wenyumeiae]RMI25643.1 aminotransferase class III-fold pyridoxal phosphate-dependent enzyme [Pseudoroseomonas wenyumeiae]
MINAFDAKATNGIAPREQELIARRQKLLGPAYRLFYANPVHVVRGEGVWLYDPDGNAYLDVYNNVASVGHCHPHVVAALSRQAAVLNTHTRYLNDTILDYAEKLLGYFPPELSHVMFTCTGSEANDLAYRAARSFTGGTGMIVTRLAYHGVTVAISEMSPSLGDGITLGAHVRTVPAPDLYRANGQDVGEAFGRAVREAIADMAAHGIRPAALLVDTIFSSDGVFSDPPGFLQPAVAAIREAGGLFIADEVQPGFGRTGEAMWGFMRHGVLPDMVTMGKPMGNGHPIAAMVARPEILERFGERTRYFNTFGGNPVSCAVGQAVLEVIENEGIVENARDVGAYLREGLRSLAQRHEAIGDIRGAGLFIGVELVRDRATREPDGEITAKLVNGLRERRILISAAGPHANVLKIRPPLVFQREHADRFLEGVDAVLGEIG